MSLTIYIYRVKKGNKPNTLNKTSWFCGRRMYWTYDYADRHCEKATDKNGYKVFKVSQKDMPFIYGIIDSLGGYDYDDKAEIAAIKRLRARKMDFTEFDYYLIAA